MPVVLLQGQTLACRPQKSCTKVVNFDIIALEVATMQKLFGIRSVRQSGPFKGLADGWYVADDME